MWLPRCLAVLALSALVHAENSEQDDTSQAFMQAAKALFADKDTMDNLQGVASAFVNSDASKQVGDMFSGGGPNTDGLSSVVSGIGQILGGNNNMGANGLSMLGGILGALTSGAGDGQRAQRSHPRGEVEPEKDSGFDFESVLNVGSMLLGQKGNADVLMGMMPMLLEALAGGSSENDVDPSMKHDHSGHSWYLPPVLEYIHVMWDHFSNSELAQALWKNSGLSNIVAQMMDPTGNLDYEKILDSFEDPVVRRRWTTSLTNFVAEWISHLSDPMIQQRYLTTIQFVGNSFLKSQGFPKTVMFDAHRPTESLARLSDAMARRHLGIKLDSSMYIKPAVAYVQELINLASEKGFIMSRINARELSSRLNKIINYDLIGPLLKAYRAYKWAVKAPECSSQILCTINEGSQPNDLISTVRAALLRAASFPAAWAVSNKVGTNFWSLYSAIMEKDGCIEKFPANCTTFHEEEIRVTTESYHSEL